MAGYGSAYSESLDLTKFAQQGEQVTKSTKGIADSVRAISPALEKVTKSANALRSKFSGIFEVTKNIADSARSNMAEGFKGLTELIQKMGKAINRSLIILYVIVQLLKIAEQLNPFKFAYNQLKKILDGLKAAYDKYAKGTTSARAWARAYGTNEKQVKALGQVEELYGIDLKNVFAAARDAVGNAEKQSMFAILGKDAQSRLKANDNNSIRFGFEMLEKLVEQVQAQGGLDNNFSAQAIQVKQVAENLGLNTENLRVLMTQLGEMKASFYEFTKSNADTDNLSKFEKAFLELKAALEGLIQSIANKLAPILTQVAQKLKEFVDWIRGWFERMGDFFDYLVAWIRKLIYSIPGMGDKAGEAEVQKVIDKYNQKWKKETQKESKEQAQKIVNAQPKPDVPIGSKTFEQVQLENASALKLAEAMKNMRDFKVGGHDTFSANQVLTEYLGKLHKVYGDDVAGATKEFNKVMGEAIKQREKKDAKAEGRQEMEIVLVPKLKKLGRTYTFDVDSVIDVKPGKNIAKTSVKSGAGGK